MIGNIGNHRVGLYATGVRLTLGADEHFKNVLTALRESKDDFNITVNTPNLSIPLQDYLTNVKKIGESEVYFTGAHYFDIYETIPAGLGRRLESVNFNPRFGIKSCISKEEAEMMIDRFNFYTFKHERNGWLNLMSLMKADLPYYDFTSHYNYSKKLEGVLSMQDAMGVSSVAKLLELKEELKHREKQFAKIPEGKFKDIFSIGGWKRMNMSQKWVPKIRQKYQETLDEIRPHARQFANDYRYIYAQNHAPEKLQQNLF